MSVREITGPMLGTEESRSSFSRQAGEPRTASSISLSTLESSCSSAFTSLPMLFMMRELARFSRSPTSSCSRPPGGFETVVVAALLGSHDHGFGRADLGLADAVPHGRKRAFNWIGGSQMLPVLGREVVEQQQCVAIFGEALGGLGVNTEL